MTTLYGKHSLDAASAEGIISAYANVAKLIPLMTGNKSKAEYHKALELIEYLIDHDELDNPLFEPLAAKIAEYESLDPEFAKLNKALDGMPGGIAVLRTIMDQLGLKAADLEGELGSKSNISNILNGRRALTVNHIKALSERFNIPADMFI